MLSNKPCSWRFFSSSRRSASALNFGLPACFRSLPVNLTEISFAFFSGSGSLCNRAGCPVAVEVFDGNTADPNTVGVHIEKLRQRFALSRVVLVGDRGMLTDLNRVSMVMAGPGVPEAECHDALTSYLDLMPTVLDLAGVSGEGLALDGQTFRPVLEGSAPQREALHLEFHPTRPGRF